jgi:hypothetical protein
MSDQSAITFGSVIELEHVETGMYLRALALPYTAPNSTQEPMVVASRDASSETEWTVHPPFPIIEIAAGAAPPASDVKDGDVVRLLNRARGTYLHSHSERSPFPPANAVTNPYVPERSDNHDNWRVKIEGSGRWFKAARFQLVHVATQRFVSSSPELSHPSIPAGQQAVGCVEGPTEDTWWSVPGAGQSDASQFPPLEVDLGPPAGSRLFATPAELSEWWLQERSFNSWLQGRSSQAARTANEAAQEIEGDLVRITAVPVRRQNLVAWQNVSRKLNQVYQKRRLIHSSSAEGRFIDDRVRSGRPDEAEGALQFFTGEADRGLVGVVSALLYRAGVTDQDIHSNRLAELHDPWGSELARTSRQADEVHTSAKEWLASAQQKAEATAIEGRTRLAALEETYNVKLALEAPVKYWRKKRMSHWCAAASLGAVFTLLAATSIYVAWTQIAPWLSIVPGAGKSIAATQASSAASGLSDEKMATPPAWKIAFLVVLALLVLWTLRILSRLLLGNVHPPWTPAIVRLSSKLI